MTRDSKYAWLVCMVAALFFMDELLRMNMFNSLQTDLRTDLGVSTADYGQLAVCYFYGNVLMLFPAGIMLDRISIRKLLTIITLICAAASVLMATSHSFLIALISRTITGLGGGFALLSIFKLATRWFTPKKMALVMGTAVTLAMLGGLIAQTPFIVLKHAIGWRNVFFVDAGIGLISAALIYSIVKDCPNDFKLPKPEKFNLTEFKQSLILAARNSHTWIAGLAISFLNLPIFIFGASWGLPYLMQYHALTDLNSSLVVSTMFMGFIIGSPLMGAWSDNYKFSGLNIVRGQSRSQLMLISSVLMIILSSMLILHGAWGLNALLMIFFTLGFFSAGQVVGYPYISENNPAELAATAGGISSTLIMGGGLVEPVFAWLLEFKGDVKYLHHIPIYSAQDYQIALSIIPITCVIALLLSIVMFRREKLEK